MAVPSRENRDDSEGRMELFSCDDDSDIEEGSDYEDVVLEIREFVDCHDNDSSENDEKFMISELMEQGHGSTSGQEQRGARERAQEKKAYRIRSPHPGLDAQADEANGWTFVPRKLPPHQPVFESETGANAPVDENSSEYDCLQLFFNSNFWKLIKTETNRYASEMKTRLARNRQLKPSSLLIDWKPVTVDELKKLFSIIIHMTLVRKESFDSYWSAFSILNTPFPGQTMRRNRFRAIYSCLHLVDNSSYVKCSEEKYDAFFKLRPYFDELCQLCESFYRPNENLVIDRGSSGFRERPHFGAIDKKIYMLYDAETGYTLRLLSCLGDSKPIEEIVTTLVEPYLMKWHTIYINRFFTNPTILEALWLKNTRAVGPFMLTRSGLPQEWQNQRLEENEMTFCHRDNLTACKWKDEGEADVCFLTTKHGATLKPDCVLDYNVNRISVDQNDKYISRYSLRKNSMPWWKKMFFRLVARSMMNAYIIYNKTHERSRSRGFVDFLTRCGEDLAIDGSCSEGVPSSGGRHNIRVATSRLTGRHFLERIPPSEKKQTRTRACKVCADVGKKTTGKRGRKETTFYCPDCNVPLCYEPCFKKYHTKRDYTD